MKQSNWLLGIGIIVAIILIAGSIYLKPSEETSSKVAEPAKTESGNKIFSILIKPIKNISSKITLIQ